MIQLQNENLGILEQWKGDMTDSTCYSVMQGIGGSAWVENIENPKGAVLVYGDFSFLLGEAVDNPEAELMDTLKKCGKTCSIFVPESKSWEHALEEKTTFIKGERYLLKEKTEPFDEELLKSYVARFPKGFEVKQIDANWYKKIVEDEWAKDLCCNFETVEKYEKYGLGFIAVKGDQIAAGISSYASYDKGIEIEIDTREEFRRLGLATVLGATMILECMERGLYPHWDAANMVSVRTAQRLGYEYNKPYVVYSNEPLKSLEYEE